MAVEPLACTTVVPEAGLPNSCVMPLTQVAPSRPSAMAGFTAMNPPLEV
jgi:hypothetical protein